MDVPISYTYTRTHDWLDWHTDNRVRIGITEFAQDLLGMIVFIELPDIGKHLLQGESYGCLESVKTVSDLCAPLSGQVVAVNERLKANPELVNLSAYEQGWIIEIELSSSAPLQDVLTAQAYAEWIEHV